MPTPARALLPLLALSAAGAAELMPINDLRVGVSVGVLAPDVSESLRQGTRRDTLDWSGNHGMTLRYEVDYFNGLSRRGIARPGFIWGLGALYSDTDIRPSSFGPGSASRPHTALQYRQYGASLYGGYATAPTITSYGEMVWEFLPVVRGGYAWGETIDDVSGSSRAGGGSFWETGGQVGWTLQDKGWLLNLYAGYTYGIASIPIDVTNGSSTLTITRSTPEVGLTIGGRF